MAKFLVTGGAGFIGSNLAKALLANGDTVRLMDNLATGRLSNIEPLLGKIDFQQTDLAKLADCRRAVDGMDYVLHHGAIPSVPRSVDDPLKTNAANVTGTLNLLLAAREAKTKRLVYAASSSAYGDSPVMPKVETMEPHPKSPYAIQKLAGEMYCQNFSKLYGLETVCLRYFNVFGPNQDPHSVYSAVIPLFSQAILQDQAPTIFGDGLTSRDFTYVDNNVQANLLACAAPRAAVGEVINVACGYEISLNQLVAKINQHCGKNIQPHYAAERAGDVKHSLADIGKAEKLLGYKPLVSFDEGLARTIEFYKADVLTPPGE
ncbi:UDP-N-acetylglucosamine 4-epimerase [Candidatus Termititenax persephonae]|uniref:UDP-N-acetylglucosamine 4-epimerase n=1 Tax=Candidatus Termititenax persephonae TaxID=2218525 RepID=A0A388TEJ1_9BACT|nr:UDP-N-acetylglucosamine 4-epimerase [Candidatus Termititenax persephonae]